MNFPQADVQRRVLRAESLAKASISAKSASVNIGASLLSALNWLSRSLKVEVRPTPARFSVVRSTVEASQPLGRALTE